MILKSITLKNIRSYVDNKILFPDGSIMLSGDIGSGKSSILLAVEFALFGVKRGEFSGNALLRNGEKEGFVELSFLIDGKDVVVKRVLKRSKESVKQDAGFIVVGGVKKDLMPAELKARIFELLGYPPSLISKSKDSIFRFTVYTPQEEMKQILSGDAETRLDTLRRIFNIAKYKQIRENASLFVREIKTKKKVYEGMTADLEHKKEELFVKKESVKDFENRALSKKAKLSMCKEAVEKSRQNRNMKEKEMAELMKVKGEMDVFDSKLMEKVGNVQKNNLKIKDIGATVLRLRENARKIIVKDFECDETSMEKEIDNMMKFIHECKTKRTLAQQMEKRIAEVGDMKSQILHKEKMLADAELSAKGIPAKENDLAKMKEDIDSLKLEIHTLSASKMEADETKKGIASLDNCPLCLQNVDHDHKKSIISKMDAKSSSAEKSLVELEKKVLELSTLMDLLDKEILHMKKKENEVLMLSSEIKALNEKEEELVKLKEEREGMGKMEDLSHIEAEVKIKRGLLTDMRENSKRLIEKRNMENNILEKENEIKLLEDEQKNLKKDIGGLNQKKAALNERYMGFSEIEKNYTIIKLEHDVLLNEEKEAEKDMVSVEKEIEGLVGLCKMLQEEIENKQSAKKKMSELSKYQAWLEGHFSNLVAVMEKQIMVKIYREFNELFQRWLHVLIEDESLTARLDEEFTPLVTQNGFDMDFGNLSGGERQSVALAYRLALNKVLNDLIHTVKTKDIIILDEPTDGFSSEQLDKIRDVLDELMIKQIIIVSHEAKIESFVDHVIRINKEEHVSRVFS